MKQAYLNDIPVVKIKVKTITVQRNPICFIDLLKQYFKALEKAN